MTASTEAAPRLASEAVIRRYYLAMAVPFLIDAVALAAYTAVYNAPQVMPPMVVLSAAFLVVGVGIGAWLLIRPIGRFLAGEVAFSTVEGNLTGLPRRS